MADITRRFGWRHLRSAPTAHIRHHKRGRLAHDGPGLSFWYRSLSAALSEVRSTTGSWRWRSTPVRPTSRT